MTMFDALVDGPDVVLRVDAHRVREDEAVEAFADFAQVVPLASNSKSRVAWLRV